MTEAEESEYALQVRHLSEMELDQMDLGENNTGSPRSTREPSAHKWYLTLNNYTEEELDQMDQIFTLHPETILCGVIGKEVGEKKETPHLQCYIKFNRKLRPRESGLFLKLGTRISWRHCKKNMPDVVGINYCTKEGDYTLYRCVRPRQMRVIQPDRPWQQSIVEIVGEEPDDRTIHWYWSKEGGVGKTAMCRYLIAKHGAIILGGKCGDIRNAILTCMQKIGTTPNLIVVNISRTQELRLSYEGLENIKDMVFYSGKYEGGMVTGACPHLICFANFEPDEYSLSKDRWVITEIKT